VIRCGHYKKNSICVFNALKYDGGDDSVTSAIIGSKKVNPRELNPYMKNDGSGYTEEENKQGDRKRKT
ncbi:hypothetical protein M8C21_032385, partial [Ambrosia artemisiifolia]